MNTIKTIVVVATLLGVGYGAHVVLNKPIPNRFSNEGGVWNNSQTTTPQLDFSEMDNSRPEISLPELQPTPLESVRSPVADLNSTASDALSQSMNGPVNDGTQTTSLAEFRRQAAATANDMATDVLERASEVAAPVFESVRSATDQAVQQLQAVPGASQNALASVNMPSAGYVADGVLPPLASRMTSPFEETMVAADESIASGQYASALLSLSKYYRDPNLPASDRGRMISLLDQLAGSAIYSHDFQLQAAHVVAAGESLNTVAARYGLSPEFLSRVNGLVPTAPLAPGTQLKVVQGPFRAEISLSAREITLFLGQYYAGRFSCAIGRDLPAQVTSLEVVRVEGPRPYVDYRTGEQIAAGDVKNPYGNRWIELQSSAMPGTAGLGIHAYGAEVEASDTRGCISVSDSEASDLAVILAPGSRITMVP
jgi:LysM repeat protein